MFKKNTVLTGLLFLLLAVYPCLAREIAVVVNKANPAQELTLAELGRIFKLDRQYWDGERVHILMRESGSWEKEIILKKVYKMTNEELNVFWLGKVFRGEISTIPVALGSEGMIKKLVNNTSGAVSFIDSRIVDDNVKVIKVEGKLPGQENYPLKE